MDAPTTPYRRHLPSVLYVIHTLHQIHVLHVIHVFDRIYLTHVSYIIHVFIRLFVFALFSDLSEDCFYLLKVVKGICKAGFYEDGFACVLRIQFVSGRFI